MKRTRKIISVLLTVLILLSSAVTAFAADTDQPALPAPADNPVDTSVYVKTVSETLKVKPADAHALLRAASELLHLNDLLEEKLTQDVLIGQNVAVVLDAVVDAISEKLESDPSLAMIAGMIKYLFANDFLINGLQPYDKFAGAVEKLKKASDNGLDTLSDVLESGVRFTSADFGFNDGDAYGFLDALVCSSSEILTSLNIRGILGDFTDSAADGSYVVGNYDLFVPLYELLELDPISSVQFTEAVELAESNAAKDPKVRFRTAANLTLKPVADLLTKIQGGGFETVIDLLPRLLYALDSGMVNELLRSLLQDKSLYGFFQFNDALEELDLNSGLLWNIVEKSFITGTEEKPAGFDFDKDGKKETTLPLTREQFDSIVRDLTFAADPIVAASVSATQKNRLALDTDDALVCAILCSALIEFAQTESGAAFLSKAVGSIEKKIVRQLAGVLLSMLQSKAGRFVLTLLARIVLHVVRIKTFIRRAKRTAIGL